MAAVRWVLRRLGLGGSDVMWMWSRRIAAFWFLRAYVTQEQRKAFVRTRDPVRYGTLFLAFEQIAREGIAGSLAECGVYRGRLSKVIHEAFPDRRLFLFDTFSGFDSRDSGSEGDERFRETSEARVVKYIGGNDNVIVRPGYFPDTAEGLEDERFAFVMIDFDKYEPTMAALDLFYPLMSPGGFVFVHDYSNPESDWACSKALNKFLSNRPEAPILIPDAFGTSLFRKV